MPVETALAIASALIVASIIGLVAVVASRRRAAQDEEMRQAASTRGWRFESVTKGGFRVHRWRGTTDGVALGRADAFRDVNEVDAFAHAGVKLVRVATFGRPSFS